MGPNCCLESARASCLPTRTTHVYYVPHSVVPWVAPAIPAGVQSPAVVHLRRPALGAGLLPPSAGLAVATVALLAAVMLPHSVRVVRQQPVVAAGPGAHLGLDCHRLGQP